MNQEQFKLKARQYILRWSNYSYEEQLEHPGFKKNNVDLTQVMDSYFQYLRNNANADLIKDFVEDVYTNFLWVLTQEPKLANADDFNDYVYGTLIPEFYSFLKQANLPLFLYLARLGNSQGHLDTPEDLKILTESEIEEIEANPQAVQELKGILVGGDFEFYHVAFDKYLFNLFSTPSELEKLAIAFYNDYQKKKHRGNYQNLFKEKIIDRNVLRKLLEQYEQILKINHGSYLAIETVIEEILKNPHLSVNVVDHDAQELESVLNADNDLEMRMEILTKQVNLEDGLNIVQQLDGNDIDERKLIDAYLEKIEERPEILEELKESKNRYIREKVQVMLKLSRRLMNLILRMI